jgi:hypothetical protein
MSSLFDSKLTEQAIKGIVTCPRCMEAIQQLPDCDIQSMFGAYLRVRKGLTNPKLIDWKHVTAQVKNYEN